MINTKIKTLYQYKIFFYVKVNKNIAIFLFFGKNKTDFV